MGNLANSVYSYFHSFFKNKEARIVMVGLDNAGKTTILYKLKLNENIETIPTIGFNVEIVNYNKVNMTVWDIGGQEKIRRLWRHYYIDVDAVIFVVDSNDTARIGEAKDELHAMLSDPLLHKTKVLVFANKQDLPHAVQAHELGEKLELRNLKQTDWWIQPCSALSGNGLYEGLDWLSSKIGK